MKNPIIIRNFKHKFGISATALLLAVVIPANAQNKISMGASVTTQISGTGFGAELSPSLMLNTGKSIINAGLNFQSRYKTLTGVRGRYEFHFNPEDGTEIFLFYDIAYHYNAYLSKNSAAREQNNLPEKAVYYNTVTLKALEQHLGFGVQTRVFERMKVFAATGAGFYNIFGTVSQLHFNYIQKNASSLMLMAGIRMDVVRIK